MMTCGCVGECMCFKSLEVSLKVPSEESFVNSVVGSSMVITWVSLDYQQPEGWHYLEV